MALPAPLEAIYQRLKAFYNGGAYDADSNPGGFARGGNQQGVFIAAMRDFADFGKGIGDIGAQAEADRQETAANAALTAGDAERTRLDRIATAQNVGLAADEVGKAAVQADRARDEADRAERTASSVDGPAIAASIAQARRHAYALQLHTGS